MKMWLKLQHYLDIKSDAIFTILFFYMLGLIAYCHVTGHPLQSEAVVYALGLVGLKTTHTVMTQGSKNG